MARKDSAHAHRAALVMLTSRLRASSILLSVRGLTAGIKTSLYSPSFYEEEKNDEHFYIFPSFSLSINFPFLFLLFPPPPSRLGRRVAGRESGR